MANHEGRLRRRLLAAFKDVVQTELDSSEIEAGVECFLELMRDAPEELAIHAAAAQGTEARDTWLTEPGTRCFAILSVDGQYHEAVLQKATPHSAVVRVQFTEYTDVVEDVSLDDVMPAPEAEELGVCELCARNVPLTRHHLYPRCMHGKLVKTMDKAELNQVALLCRSCHSAVHRLHGNAELAASYHSVELLLADEAVQRWVLYASKLKKQSRQEHGLLAARARRDKLSLN
ncbi:uncharacterized protein MONBRDRAFT_28829 [Monosiga brevicollis MX1]|uniref:Tudor domain-containing protein n=1 Tax=Monosiga brevicollis TaxID=81824 RepID=A9V9J8_MONBE|nr:uncharacterized protein MONBRDRAFT_28829 [Monosiga brevicollis MX1]EDQ85876.1 predicted protein [Monosiga brevicollis MX1]|eukprot:XP_001749355.1 hypothetical protein [Monosiga brevicollis MX1]